MDPNFAFAHNQLGQAYLQKQMNVEAIAEMEKAVQLSSGSPTCIANLARAYVASGRKGEAIKLLNDLKQGSNRSDSRLGDCRRLRSSWRQGSSDDWLEGLRRAIQSWCCFARLRSSSLGRPLWGLFAVGFLKQTMYEQSF
jgi:tetratricopeptide (TPR) repeat protein